MSGYCIPEAIKMAMCPCLLILTTWSVKIQTGASWVLSCSGILCLQLCYMEQFYQSLAFYNLLLGLSMVMSPLSLQLVVLHCCYPEDNTAHKTPISTHPSHAKRAEKSYFWL